MKFFNTLIVLFALTMTVLVFADSKENTFNSDLVFVKKTAYGGMAEVEFGKLAEKKSSNSEIKSYGGKLVNDHNAVNNELKSIVSKKGIEFPNDMGEKHKEFYQSLESENDDAKFDRVFIQHMIHNHKGKIHSFNVEAKVSADKELRDFAKKTLPVLEDHLKTAEEIEPKIKSNKVETAVTLLPIQ